MRQAAKVHMLAAWCLAGLCGCSELVLQGPQGQVDRTFVGLVRIRHTPWHAEGAASAPSDVGSGPAEVTEFTATGLTLNRGLSLGHTHEQRITLPLDCKVLIVLQAGSVVPTALLQSLKQAQACFAPLERRTNGSPSP
jgi:hypothetical protein